MVLTAILAISVAMAYVGLGTVRFIVVTEAVLRYARMARVPLDSPPWMPDFVRQHFPKVFRLSARMFFLGCAYTHFEIAAHALAGDLSPDYTSFIHWSSMALQAIGAWSFVGVLSIIDDAFRKA